jgi:asparagine synthetase B (glutamine-hydrolysing)
MCGLLFSLRLVASTLDTDDPAFDALLQAVTPRGPDSLKVHVSHVALPAGHTVEVKLAASVLGLRGQEVTAQPLENDDAVLGWNGQVFQGMDIGLDENDTTKLFERLRHERFEDVLASIEGP